MTSPWVEEILTFCPIVRLVGSELVWTIRSTSPWLAERVVLLPIFRRVGVVRLMAEAEMLPLSVKGPCVTVMETALVAVMVALLVISS